MLKKPGFSILDGMGYDEVETQFLIVENECGDYTTK
jgi:hypothetical protein